MAEAAAGQYWSTWSHLNAGSGESAPAGSCSTFSCDEHAAAPCSVPKVACPRSPNGGISLQTGKRRGARGSPTGRAAGAAAADSPEQWLRTPRGGFRCSKKQRPAAEAAAAQSPVKFERTPNGGWRAVGSAREGCCGAGVGAVRSPLRQRSCRRRLSSLSHMTCARAAPAAAPAAVRAKRKPTLEARQYARLAKLRAEEAAATQLQQQKQFMARHLEKQVESRATGRSFAQILQAFGAKASDLRPEALRKEYRKRLACYHPDRMQSRGCSTVQCVEAEEIYKTLRNAHDDWKASSFSPDWRSGVVAYQYQQATYTYSAYVYSQLHSQSAQRV